MRIFGPIKNRFNTLGSEKNKLLTGALIISFGAFFSRAIGAFYRIPLTNILGSEGIGIYQTVFPVYCILLTVSSQAIPGSLSKIVSSSPEKGNYILRSAILLFGAIGLLLCGLMFVLRGMIAQAQGEPRAAAAYGILAPSVFLVALISCFRGYFQGKTKMTPTAISQLVEQIIKLVFGLTLCYFFGKNIAEKAALAVFAVTLSEVVCLGYLFSIYVYGHKKEKLLLDNERTKETSDRIADKKNIIKTFSAILSLSLPLTLACSLYSLSHFADSFFIVNILKNYRNDGISLFGLFSGCAAAVINLPVAMSYGVAVAAIPKIAKSPTSGNFRSVCALTFFVSIPSALFLAAFSRPVSSLLYSKLSIDEQMTVANLILCLSPSILFLSFMQTSNAVLLATESRRALIISPLLALAVKIITTPIFLNLPKLNIFGAAISSNLCFFVAVIVNLVYIIRGKFVEKKFFTDFVKILFSAITAVGFGLLIIKTIDGASGLLISAMLSATMYFIMCFVFRLKLR